MTASPARLVFAASDREEIFETCQRAAVPFFVKQCNRRAEEKRWRELEVASGMIRRGAGMLSLVH